MKGYARTIIRNEKGIALLLAVTVITLLVAITVQFNKDMRQELVSSANILSSAKMNAIAKSGFNLALAVLKQDSADNGFDTYHDSWAELGSSDLAQVYGSGKLETVITDLSGRIQLNSLVGNSSQGGGGSAATKTREVLLRLLLSGDLGDYSSEDASLIVDAITDWIDNDDNEKGIEETESSFYYSLRPSYSSKNGPMEFVEELLLVRGITEELYFGNQESPGLRDLVTANGSDGKININTAPAPVLKALGEEMSDDLAEEMISFREDKENKDLLRDASWYANISQWPSDVQLESSMVTTSSSYFRVVSRAENNDMEKTMTSVVHRQPGGELKMISRRVD